MSEQSAFMFGGAARRGDPETAKRAAEKVKAKPIRELILWWLGPTKCPWGMTIAELAEALDRKEVSVSPRIAEMRREGLIRDSGRRKKNRGTDTEAILWERTKGETE